MLKPVFLDERFLGRALPWDIYAQNGVLLARAGTVISDARHLQSLNARALFRHGDDPELAFDPAAQLLALAVRAETVLREPQAKALITVVDDLLSVFDSDPDFCLGILRRVSWVRPSVQHCLHAMFVSAVIGKGMGFEDESLRNLAGAALSMNCADLDLHDALWHRRMGLNAKARARLHSHPLRAAERLEKLGIAPDWVNHVRQHHENCDGSGYPAHLTLERIGLGARILRVADVYCAQVSERFYRPPRLPHHALRELFGARRTQLDFMVMHVLLRRMGRYPPGTLVLLANQEKACVTRRPAGDTIRRVVSFLDGRDQPLTPPRERDVTHRATAIRAYIEAQRRWPPIRWAALWGY